MSESCTNCRKDCELSYKEFYKDEIKLFQKFISN